ncbi:kinase-like domain-containing protein [Blakeslea trispora]|nr:kinase-like domain-containing protein [Blakeslea trispora]
MRDEHTKHHVLRYWKSMDSSLDQPPRKRSLRRFSLFKPVNQQLQSSVLTTHTIQKEYDPETGNKIINNYMVIREIGRGVHGKVKLAEDLETGELVAIKIVDKQSRRRQLGYSQLRAKNHTFVKDKESTMNEYNESEQKIRREIAILKKCVHPHVVQLREVIDDTASRKIYLVLEYMEGGEVVWQDPHKNNCPLLSLDETRKIFRDVVSGLDYLHYQGIIHRDIKPANLLLTHDRVVKISDFGVSYFNQHLARNQAVYDDEIDRELAETAGTPAFFAPELCSSSDMRHITKAIDVWALGITLYCLVYGQCPFTAATEFELFEKIPTEPLAFPSCVQVPETLKDLLSQLLTKQPKDRITLDQVKHHPWVLEGLSDPILWWKEADPTCYHTVQVTNEDMARAVTLMDRLRKSVRRISSSLSTFIHHFSRYYSRSPSIAYKTPKEPLYPFSVTDSHSLYPLQEEGWAPFQISEKGDEPGSSCFDDRLSHPASSFQTHGNESSGSSLSGLVIQLHHDKSNRQ